MGTENDVLLELELMKKQLEIITKEYGDILCELSVLRTITRTLLITHHDKQLVGDIITIQMRKQRDLRLQGIVQQEESTKILARLGEEQQIADKELAGFLAENRAYLKNPKTH